MPPNSNLFDRLELHWAVQAINPEDRKRAVDLSTERWVKMALGEQLNISHDESTDEQELIDRVALAYETVAIEGLNAIIHPIVSPSSENAGMLAEAAALLTYKLRRSMGIPREVQMRIFHVLHLGGLSYCCDQWTDFRRWIGDNQASIIPPSGEGQGWDIKLLFRIYDAWLRLFRKDGWNDLHGVLEIVAQLREQQIEFESLVLNSDNPDKTRSVAWRLIALYHWAKASELLSRYVTQGEPSGVEAEISKHFESAISAATSCHDYSLVVLLNWLHATSHKMIAGSLWKVARTINSRMGRFVEHVSHNRSLFELLPPQRMALYEQGLLDPASRAIVIELPTSGGKTTLAEFRIIQALGQFSDQKGWVAYIAPTRALVSQITRQLREDLGPIDIRVEQLSGAIEIDAFEDTLLGDTSEIDEFDVLVCTPEKLQLVIRNHKIDRPLILVVCDEAHNIEDQERGLRVELLLATIKREHAGAHFLLLMPDAPNKEQVARWLGADAGRTISIGTTAWQPNERIIGVYKAAKIEDGARGDWALHFETLQTTPKTIHLRGVHKAGSTRPLSLPFSQADTNHKQTAAIAKVFSNRGTSIAVANTINNAWSMARTLRENTPELLPDVPEPVQLVQRFLHDEICPQFELIEMLNHGIAVHHAGLSDEARSLIEWLAREDCIRVLCATTTIAQGINFPVASVFLAARTHPLSGPPYQREISARDFWNLAGRAGRIKQKSIGVVGLAEGTKRAEIEDFLRRASGELVSQLINLLDQIEVLGEGQALQLHIDQPQWADFRAYVAHLWSESQNLETVLLETESLLRSTFGYEVLRGRGDPTSAARAQALLLATQNYVRKLSEHPEYATLADATGFTPEGVRSAISEMGQLPDRLALIDWQPTSIFGDSGSSRLSLLVGAMMRIPEISQQLNEIGRSGLRHEYIADLMIAWVNGKSILDITETFFTDDDDAPLTNRITETCKVIYRTLTNLGPWGLSALTKVPTSGLDFDGMTEVDKRRINSLPAMIYHGVKTEEAVLMRMNSVPRSISETLGANLAAQNTNANELPSIGAARSFLRSLSETEWHEARPENASMSGADYKRIWTQLSGESC